MKSSDSGMSMRCVTLVLTRTGSPRDVIETRMSVPVSGSVQNVGPPESPKPVPPSPVAKFCWRYSQSPQPHVFGLGDAAQTVRNWWELRRRKVQRHTVAGHREFGPALAGFAELAARFQEVEQEWRRQRSQRQVLHRLLQYHHAHVVQVRVKAIIKFGDIVGVRDDSLDFQPVRSVVCVHAEADAKVIGRKVKLRIGERRLPRYVQCPAVSRIRG